MTNERQPFTEVELEKIISHKLLDLCIRIGLIGFLVVHCYQIFRPFIGLMLWSVILAVALYPLHALIARKIGGREAPAAIILIVAIMLGVLVPTTFLAISFADSTTQFVKEVEIGNFHISPPSAIVAEWPVIGEKVHSLWSAAHADIGTIIAKIESKIGSLTKEILLYAASVGTAILTFVVALLLAGVLMVYASSSHAAAKAIAGRIVGAEKGSALIALSIATIRTVAQGVIGIACIQALLMGAGFILVGIPAAGLLALLVLVIGIMQIPTLLISLPTIVYVFSTHSTTVAIIFAIYTVIVGAVEHILKPLMLGRGVDAPMPVILIGALGGMASSGFVGLFLGAVLLTLGYQLFMVWVHSDAYQETVEQ